MKNDNSKDFQLKVQRIGDLVRDLENIADPESRVSAKALVQLLLDLHSAGLERVMEIVAGSGDTGQGTGVSTGGHHVVDLGGRLEGACLVDGHEGVDGAVEGIDALERVRDELTGGGATGTMAAT